MLSVVARRLVLAGVLLTVPVLAFGQGGRAQLNGTVVDQGKAVLPGAIVTATHEGTNLAREATTGPEGRFIITTLTPGIYTVRVALQGFQTQSRTGVVVSVGQELTIDFAMNLAGVAEEIRVTATAPVIEITTSRVGTNISTNEIDNLPAGNRSQFALMQLVPGMVPSLNPGSFEGDNFSSSGLAANSNLFQVDGVYNNDERNGGSNAQARIALDAMAEFQVLTHQYTAEFGGSAGAVINAVTRSGQNRMFGRAFYYLQDDKLTSTDYFAKQRGEENPDTGRKTFGFNFGGPIVKNKAFWFFNLERSLIDEAVILDFPADAAPLAISFSDTQKVKNLNTILRTDYQAGAQNFSFRWTRDVTPSIGENWEANRSTRDNVFIENDAGDQIVNGNWTAVIGNRATNEFKVTHVRESVLQGNTQYFSSLTDLDFIELNGRDQFDIGSDNRHPDYAAGPRASHGTAKGRTYVVSDDFTFVKNGWGGNHAFKVGGSHSWVLVRPQIAGGNDNGTFTFLSSTATGVTGNRPFNPADAFTYPGRFSIRLGQIYFDLTDRRTASYFQDKWQLTNRLTLNLGLRYDYQTLTKNTKDAIAPRLGFAYDPTGSGKTVIRGGVGKFYEYILAGVHGVLQQQAVISPSNMYDTGQDTSATRGVIPSNVCLQPSANNGLAIISPACRAFLTDRRNQVNAQDGRFVNSEPTLDGDRRMGYLWSFSLGLKHELARNIAVGVDYIGNRARDQVGLVDINEGPPLATGIVTRRGVSGFDSGGTLIPSQARTTTFQRVLQYQTLDALNPDYNALEFSLEKRYANRWSSRFQYTLARARDVGTGVGRRFTNDLNPRDDYGPSSNDNRHAVSFSVNVNPWRGFGAGTVFRSYSGNPINETVGLDVNGDRDNTDRPVRGVHDLIRPILSPLDANGRAVRNGIGGEKVVILDLRLQYVVPVQTSRTIGFFWEIYNAIDGVNYGNPTGVRSAANFMVRRVAGEPRTMQLGIRYTF